MKAYPLIYSRTKNVDFVPDFLVRPEDLDWQTALKYVENAMANLDILKTIRYSVFSVGNYCICGGISCVTKYLVEELKKSGSTFDFQAVSEYLRDCKGRSIACFIGFAIPKSPKSEMRSGRIPNIPLSKYWKEYLEYLKHQWDKSTTHSEELNFPPVTLDEKTYSSNDKPEFEQIQEKKVIRNQKEKLQRTLDYFFDQILNKGSQDSFISDIDRNEWDALKFTCASVSDDFYRALKSTPQTTTTQEDSFGSIMGMRKSERSASVSVSNDDSEMKSYMHEQIKTSPKPPTTYPNSNCQRPSHETGSKKNNANLFMGIIAAAVLVVVIVAIIALVLGKGTQATAFSLPLDEMEKVLKNNF